MVQALTIILSFTLPCYHLEIHKNGTVLTSAEDLTLLECKARLKTLKKSDHAKCVYDEGERELA